MITVTTAALFTLNHGHLVPITASHPVLFTLTHLVMKEGLKDCSLFCLLKGTCLVTFKCSAILAGYNTFISYISVLRHCSHCIV